MSPESLERPAEDGESGRTIADELRLWLRILTILQVVITLVLIGGVYYFSTQSIRTHDALCNIRADQVRRLNQTSEFLIKHPNGAFGLSRTDLELVLRNSRRSIQSLDNLKCPSVPIKDINQRR